MIVNYTPPPTIASFMRSDAFGRLLAGPVGSGKTTGCMFEVLRRSMEQAPARDGYRYTRWAVVRQTLKQLKDTVRKDVEAWLSPIAHYRVTDSMIRIQVGSIRSEWLLIPLDDPQDQRRLLSMQLTGAWLSEAIEMQRELISAISGRCGRYPSGALGTPSWMGIIADTNMPIAGSEWHDFMERPPPDWQIFIQPGGLTPYAENLQWLTQTEDTIKLPEDDPVRLAQGRLYYERLKANNAPDWVKRYVDSKFGDDPSGTAVFKHSYKPSVEDKPYHLQSSIDPVPGRPLIIGQDFGRDPWSILCQPDHRGRLLVLEEVAGTDIGLENHIMHNLRPVLTSSRYLRLPKIVIGDPAGRARSTVSEETSFDVCERMGLIALPSPSNRLESRLNALETFMLAQSNGGPAFMVDAGRCPVVAEGLRNGYRFGVTTDGMRKPSPEKNEYSHPVDALEYAAQGASQGMEVFITNRLASRMRGGVGSAPVVPVGGWT